jgi:hypothetical protein
MLVIKFIRDNNSGYKCYSIRSYSVWPEKRVIMFEQDDGNVVTVPYDGGYSIAYVTNTEGKTIDKVALA